MDKKRARYKSYNPARMEEAMAAVQKQGKTMYRAAKQFGVPMNTLRDRLIAKGILTPKRQEHYAKDEVPGKQRKLSKEQAKVLNHVTIEDDMIERWQGIGKKEGLKTDAAIARFLLSLYYQPGKQEEQKADIRCKECHSPLSLFCINCQLISPSSPPSKEGLCPVSDDVHETSQPVLDTTVHLLPADNTSTETVIKTEVEANSIPTLDTVSRRKRLKRSCEKKKKYTELEECNDDGLSGSGEDNIGGDDWPDVENITRDRNSNGNEINLPYSMDEFLTELEKQCLKNPRNKTHECPECNEAFLKAIDLQQHLEDTNHKPDYMCKQCGKLFKNKSALQQHERVHNRQDHQCPTCGLSFKFPSRLNKHLKTHGTDRPHVCDKCGKSFVSVYYLKDHIKIHSEERRYKCNLCDAAFKQKPALYAHGKKHSDEKPFQCQYCGLKFRDSQKVKIHVRKHTGEKPYQCGMCDARFVSNSNMWQHCAYVHGKSTKTHQCPRCPLTFAAKGKLKVHIKNAHSIAEDDAQSCRLEAVTEMRQTVQPFFINVSGNDSCGAAMPTLSAIGTLPTLCNVSL